MKKSLLVLLAAVVLAAAFAVVLPSSARAADTVANERTMIRLINEERVARGLPALRVHRALAKASRSHAKDMLKYGYLSHNSRDGSSFVQRLQRFGYARKGYKYWSAGEVVGWGQGAFGTPEASIRKWMSSPKHRATILDKRWRDIGVGCAAGTFKVKQQEYPNAVLYTVDFGCRRR